MGTAWAGTPLFPEVILAALVLIVVAIDATFWPRRPSGNLGYLALCGLLLVLSAAFEEWTHGTSGTAFHDLVFLDPYATFFDILVIAAALCAVLLALGADGASRVPGEFYPLLMLAALGMMLTASAADLIALFLGLELAALPLWALSALGRRDGVEAAAKFLLLGMFGSALVLFGIALLYGAAGSTELQALVAVLSSEAADMRLAVPGGVLLVSGLLLKAGAVPFHAWLPDAREGAPLPVSAFIAMALPVAGFAALGRVVLYGLAPAGDLWMPLVEVAAIASMVGGGLLAATQRNIRRLLAYVGVGQLGCAMVGLLSASEAGLAALLSWLVALALALAGCYAVLALCGPPAPNLRDYWGLSRRQPLVALALGLCLASLAGLPPTAGFVGRLYLLDAALEADRLGLALVLAGSFPLLLYACMRVFIAVFARPAKEALAPVRWGAETLVVLLLSVLGTLGLGLWPSALLRAARETAVAVL